MLTTGLNTLHHVNKIASYSRDPRNIVVTFLLDLGVPTDLIGFEFLITAIIFWEADPACLLNDNLYIAVAEHYNNCYSVKTIENAIRRAITEAWKNKFNFDWEHYFPTPRVGKMEKPSNLKFIARLARALQLCRGCIRAGNRAETDQGGRLWI